MAPEGILIVVQKQEDSGLPHGLTCGLTRRAAHNYTGRCFVNQTKRSEHATDAEPRPTYVCEVFEVAKNSSAMEADIRPGDLLAIVGDNPDNKDLSDALDFGDACDRGLVDPIFWIRPPRTNPDHIGEEWLNKYDAYEQMLLVRGLGPSSWTSTPAYGIARRLCGGSLNPRRGGGVSNAAGMLNSSNEGGGVDPINEAALTNVLRQNLPFLKDEIISKIVKEYKAEVEASHTSE